MLELWIFLGIYAVIGICFLIFLQKLRKKIELLELQIKDIFQKRLNLIPSLCDISKNYILKHSEVFEEILSLKRQQLYVENDFYEYLHTQGKIHHELNFVFTVLNKNTPLQKNGKYLLLKDLFIENSARIGKNMVLHSKIVKTYNSLVQFKSLTLVGIFIKIEKK